MIILIARPWALYAGKEAAPMNYYYLYIPAVVFFLLPLLNALYAAAVARAAAREKERKKAAAAAAKEAAEQERKAKQAARAATASDPVQEPKRKRGRPRKNPLPEQRAETILPEVPAVQEEPPAVQTMTIQRTSIIPNIDKMEPPCTPEEFADRIR